MSEKLRELYEKWEKSDEWMPEEMEFSEPYKLENHYKYSRSCGFYAGYKTANKEPKEETPKKQLQIAINAFQKILDSDADPFDFIYETLEKIENVGKS